MATEAIKDLDKHGCAIPPGRGGKDTVAERDALPITTHLVFPKLGDIFRDNFIGRDIARCRPMVLRVGR